MSSVQYYFDSKNAEQRPTWAACCCSCCWIFVCYFYQALSFACVFCTSDDGMAGCAETNLGGTLQLLVDLKFVAGAFSPLVRASHEAVIAAAREKIVAQALAIANDDHGEETDPLLDRLEGWLATAEVHQITISTY